jgi:hypothetical protein
VSEVRGCCQCGDVRYRALLDPGKVDTCYCAWCTRSVGSAVTVWAHLRAADFAFTDGEPRRYESSPGVFRTFCGRCGSSLTYEYRDGERLDLSTATLYEPEAFPPTSDGPGAPDWLAFRPAARGPRRT